MTLLYYFVPHDPPSFIVRNTGLTVLRASLPNKVRDPDHASHGEEVHGSDDEHVEDDERSWYSLNADDLSHDMSGEVDETPVTNDVESVQVSESDPDHVTSHTYHVRGHESLRLLSHVLVLETVSSEHSLTHLLAHQSRDSSPPVHHVSRYFRKSHSLISTSSLNIAAEQTTPKKRKSASSNSARGRKKSKK